MNTLRGKSLEAACHWTKSLRERKCTVDSSSGPMGIPAACSADKTQWKHPFECSIISSVNAQKQNLILSK